MRETTAGPSQNYNMNFMQVGTQQGWQCPICKRILSPWIPECPCRGQGVETYTTTSVSTSGDETIFLRGNKEENK